MKLDVQELINEIERALPDPVFVGQVHQLPKTDFDGYVVLLGDARVSTEFTGLAALGCTHIEHTIYVDYRAKCLPNETVHKILNAQRAIVEALKTIPETAGLTLQGFDEPSIGTAESDIVEARTEWLFRYDL